MSTILIRHAYKHVKDPNTEEIVVFFKSKRIVSSCSKRYHNCMHKTAKLTPCARNLMDYLTEKMNKENEVENSVLLKKEFIEFMDKSCGVTYTTNTVNKAFQELKGANLLVSFSKMKGLYVVNPLHFFNSTEQKRTKLLQKLLNSIPTCDAGTNLAEAFGFAV